MRALDAVFLDAGNTIIGMDASLIAEVAQGEGLRVSAAAVARAEAAARPAVSRRLAGGVSSETADTFTFYVEQILAHADVACADRPATARRLAVAVKRLPTVRLWSVVLPGVPDALQRLRAAGIRLVVVSNSDGTVEEGLARAGLRALVDDVVDSTRVGAEKPDPRIFTHALGVAGAAAERVVHVGDLYAVDVVGARRCGIEGVLLDPHGDWPAVDCPVHRDLAAFATALLGPA